MIPLDSCLQLPWKQYTAPGAQSCCGGLSIICLLFCYDIEHYISSRCSQQALRLLACLSR